MTSELENGKRRGKGTSGSSRSRAAKAPNPFINVTLTTEQEEAKRRDMPQYPDVFNRLDEALDNGLAITLKYDDYSSAYSCFIRDTDPDSQNADLVLTGRGGTAASALREALFLAANAPDGDWTALRNPDRRSYSSDDF